MNPKLRNQNISNFHSLLETLLIFCKQIVRLVPLELTKPRLVLRSMTASALRALLACPENTSPVRAAPATQRRHAPSAMSVKTARMWYSHVLAPPTQFARRAPRLHVPSAKWR